jgi:[citrate (pro-3S)-lyase] ligase
MRTIDLSNVQEVGKVKAFLKSHFNLGYDKDTEYTIVIEKKGEIVATASYAGNVIKQIAIHKDLSGTGQASQLIERVIERMIESGIMHLFVYTHTINKMIFLGLGFTEVAAVHPHVILLEWGNESIKTYCDELRKRRVFDSGSIGALVMNCNPFTLGHQYLIETAANRCEGVYIFAVEEDQSTFPFEARMELIKKGTDHLENVVIIPGGQYIISQATFPAYFSQEKDLLSLQTELDAEVFGRHLAKALSINTRFVGTEPYCQVTSQYNQSLKKVIPGYGVQLIEIERKTIEGLAVSAKTVREAVRLNDWKLVEKMVPSATYQFLQSERALPIIDEIRKGNSRH